MRLLLFRLLASFVCGAIPAAATIELDREIVLAPHEGAGSEDVEIRRCQERAEATTATAADYEQLGWAYVAKARRTLDAGYFKLAEKTVDVLDARFGASAASRLLRGHVLHNLHRFHEAETIARKLVAERGAADDFALLSDALMEQGELADAIAACQKLTDLRPGLEAYSRIAHLRWLKGDLAGATTAMEMAMRATGANDAEANAWALARLSGYYLQAGRTEAALTAADAANRHATDYAPALLARGRALLALGKNEDAVVSLRRAEELNPLPEYQWWLADALRVVGRASEAAKVEAELMRRGETSDPRTYALFLVERADPSALSADANAAQTSALRSTRSTSLRLAREELEVRADVHTHDALAWALAANGDLTEAEKEMQLALREGTRDPRLFLHAAEMARRRGEHAAAADFFARARPLALALTPSERARIPTAPTTAAAN